MSLVMTLSLFNKFWSSIVILWTISLSMDGINGALIKLRSWLLVRILDTLNHGMSKIMKISLLISLLLIYSTIECIIMGTSIALQRVHWSLGTNRYARNW